MEFNLKKLQHHSLLLVFMAKAARRGESIKLSRDERRPGYIVAQVICPKMAKDSRADMHAGLGFVEPHGLVDTFLIIGNDVFREDHEHQFIV